jgi:hypothetical protein
VLQVKVLQALVDQLAQLDHKVQQANKDQLVLLDHKEVLE